MTRGSCPMAADLQRPRGSDLAIDRHAAQNPSFFSRHQSLLSHAPSSRDEVEAVTANTSIRLNAHLLSWLLGISFSFLSTQVCISQTHCFINIDRFSFVNSFVFGS